MLHPQFQLTPGSMELFLFGCQHPKIKNLPYGTLLFRRFYALKNIYMETYLAYFDILGFKEFILNADRSTRSTLMSHLMRDSQMALSKGKSLERTGGGLNPDLSDCNIHCLHISDSILFWTNDTSSEMFKELIECCAKFLMQCMQITFPLRGCIVLGEIEYQPFAFKNKNEVWFQNSSLYGVALTHAYLKAEAQDWVGCFIDRAAVAMAGDELITELIYGKQLVYYPVPFNDGSFSYEFALRTINRTINDVYLKNLAKGMEEMFQRHTGGKPLSESVRRKLTNTIKFYDYFRTNTETE
jgi:hypothetical protein